MLLAAKAEPNLNLKGQASALYFAGCNGHLECCRHLLDARAAIDHADLSNGRNAMWWASKEGHQPVVQLLFDRGADVHHCLHERAELAGCSGLHMASRHGHADVVQTWLEHGADLLKPETKAKDTPLHLACRAGHVGTCKLLLKHGAPVELTNDMGESPLSLAQSSGNEELAELVKLQVGAI